jgi:hypothetical protein
LKDIREKIKEAVAKAIDSGAHLNIANASEAIAKKLGLSERWIEYTHVEFRNKLNEIAYKRTPYKERILFLPHCLRNSKECKASYNEEGLQCTECGKCKIAAMIKEAKKLGYKGVFVCPGGSIVIELIKKYQPKAVLGVCCYKEAMLAFDSLRGTKVAPQAVLLTRAGCINTDVNVDEVIEKMRLIKETK